MAATSGGFVALLFTDLVGSTALLDRLGDDAAEETRRVHFSLLRRAVEETGGEEVKNLGDGLMVAFPSALSSLRCAVRMQEAVASSRPTETSAPLSVRIGIHAGEPFREDDDFFGTAVVVAKRLCDRAGGGQILTTDLVAALVGSRGGFRFRPVGSLELKGLAEPVSAIAVDWEPVPPLPADSDGAEPARRRPAPVAPRGPRLAGRGDELACLKAELARAEAGEFTCVLLAGEPGVGKTRLARELLAGHGDGLLALSARAYPLGTTDSLGVWVEALERHLRPLAAADIQALCGRYLNDLAGLLPSVAAARGAPPERESLRVRLLEGLAVLLENLARQQPVVVFLDDVHLADGSSWESLQFLARHLADAPLLLLLAARAAELAENPLAGEVLFDLDQDGVLTRLRLAPLDRGAIADLAAAVVHDTAPAALVDWLAVRSQGNPLFTIGLLRALQDEGADLSAPCLRRLPEALSERVGARLQGLSGLPRETLEALAVLGRQVSIAELAAVTSQPVVELTRAVEELRRGRLVSEDERGHELLYEIVHPLITEAVYESSGGARRLALHRSAGRALLASGRLGEAASHFARSARPGDPEAVDALREALRQAEERYAFREALEILASLGDLLPAGDGRWREVAGVMAAQPDWVIDHQADASYDRGIDAMRRIDDALASSPDERLRAEMKFRLANFLAWGADMRLEDAELVCRQAVSLFEQAGNDHGVLLAATEVAFLHGLLGNLTLAGQEAEAAAVAAEAAGYRDIASRAVYVSTVFGDFFSGRFEAAEVELRRSMDIARRSEQGYQQFRSSVVLAISLAQAGSMSKARAVLQEGRAAYPPGRENPLRALENTVDWLAGDFPAALANGREWVVRNPAGLGSRMAWGMPYAGLAAAECGQAEDAERFLAMTLHVYRQDFIFMRQVALWARFVVDWHEGRRGQPLDFLEDQAERILEMGGWPFAVPVFLDLAELAAEVGDGEMSEKAARRLDVLAEQTDRSLYQALAGLASAFAALASGHDQNAVVPARAAAKLLEGSGYRAFFGRALDTLGRTLMSNDPKGARVALRQAQATFDECGAVRRAARAAAEMPSR